MMGSSRLATKGDTLVSVSSASHDVPLRYNSPDRAMTALVGIVAGLSVVAFAFFASPSAL